MFESGVDSVGYNSHLYLTGCATTSLCCRRSPSDRREGKIPPVELAMMTSSLTYFSTSSNTCLFNEKSSNTHSCERLTYILWIEEDNIETTFVVHISIVHMHTALCFILNTFFNDTLCALSSYKQRPVPFSTRVYRKWKLLKSVLVG